VGVKVFAGDDVYLGRQRIYPGGDGFFRVTDAVDGEEPVLFAPVEKALVIIE
jgi:hypothetical protein